MKRIYVFVLFFAIFVMNAFCSWSGGGVTYSLIKENEAQLAEVIAETLEANGCGAYNSAEWVIVILDAIGDKEACDQHDIDYATLGMSKEEADERFYYNIYKRVYENHARILSSLKNSSDFNA